MRRTDVTTDAIHVVGKSGLRQKAPIARADHENLLPVARIVRYGAHDLHKEQAHLTVLQIGQIAHTVPPYRPSNRWEQDLQAVHLALQLIVQPFSTAVNNVELCWENQTTLLEHVFDRIVQVIQQTLSMFSSLATC